MAPETFIVNFEFPFKGLDAAAALSQTQPPYTCIDCLNVLPVDRNYRVVGGQRPGLTNDYNVNSIDFMGQARTIYGTNRYRLIIIHNIPTGPPGATDGIRDCTVGSSGAITVLYTDNSIYSVNSMAATATRAYLVSGATTAADGALYKYAWYDSVANPTPLAAAIGTAPGCRIVTVWRDRVVVAGTDGSPFLLSASRVSDGDDWDTAPLATGDPASPFAINLGQAGQIGDTITALVPISDDMLLVGCSRSIYRVDGDPADGGSVSLVTNGIGITSNTSWCQADDGTIYFLGDDGLFRMRPGGLPENVSGGRIPRLVRFIDAAAYQTHVVYDARREGVWVFISKPPSLIPVFAGAQYHFFYYIPSGGFFPISLAQGFIRAALRYQDDEKRFLLLASNTTSTTVDLGIFHLDDAAKTDAGTAISSYVFIGAVMPDGDTREAKLLSLEAILADKQPSDDAAAGTYADSNWSLTYDIRAATDQLTAYTSPAQTQTGTWANASGRHAPKSHRMAENSFMLKLYNTASGKIWAMQRIIARFQKAGQNR